MNTIIAVIALLHPPNSDRMKDPAIPAAVIKAVLIDSICTGLSPLLNEYFNPTIEHLFAAVNTEQIFVKINVQNTKISVDNVQ
jgi:hypothetical protein